MIEVAKICFDAKTVVSGLKERIGEFWVENKSSDEIITITKKDIDFENNGENRFSEYYLQFVATQRKIAEKLPYYQAMAIHGVLVDVCGTGVVFSAKSGTGKSTHMMRWQKYLGDSMKVVNGDKPVVRFFDLNETEKFGLQPNIPYGFGSPWKGKENLGCNMQTPLKHICFIERSETNWVESVKKEAVIDRIFNQVYMPKEPIAVMNTIQLIDRLLDSCQLWIIHCNMDDNAGEIAYKAIFGEK